MSTCDGRITKRLLEMKFPEIICLNLFNISNVLNNNESHRGSEAGSIESSHA